MFLCFRYDDGGLVKVSYTTAFTVSMLSWAYFNFKDGFKASNSLDFGANTIRWGADYLMKATINSTRGAAGPAQTVFVTQVSTQVGGGRLLLAQLARLSAPGPSGVCSDLDRSSGDHEHDRLCMRSIKPAGRLYHNYQSISYSFYASRNIANAALVSILMS
jgi:hypothetical protein